MSKRENIAANIITTLNGMTSVSLAKLTRNPFDFERLSNAQFPAAWIQSGTESREDTTINSVTRLGIINYTLIGFVKSSDIDTSRNELIEAIEEELTIDVTRGGYAIDTQVIEIGTDEGALDPLGGIEVTIAIKYNYTRGTT